MKLRHRFATVLFILSLILSSCASFKGEKVSPVTAAPEISMTDQNGNPFQLSGMQGKVVMVFFGFTNCVDECPLTMAHIKQALGLLGNSASDVRVVLVSTDPVRDTPQALKDFLGKFDPAYIGIPGTVDQLSKLWDAYDVEVLDGGETHSSFTYVIDKGGRLRLKFDPETAPEDMASDLKILLAEK